MHNDTRGTGGLAFCLSHFSWNAHRSFSIRSPIPPFSKNQADLEVNKKLVRVHNFLREPQSQLRRKQLACVTLSRSVWSAPACRRFRALKGTLKREQAHILQTLRDISSQLAARGPYNFKSSLRWRWDGFSGGGAGREFWPGRVSTRQSAL